MLDAFLARCMFTSATRFGEAGPRVGRTLFLPAVSTGTIRAPHAAGSDACLLHVRAVLQGADVGAKTDRVHMDDDAEQRKVAT
jgi:hypothetical protein